MPSVNLECDRFYHQSDFCFLRRKVKTFIYWETVIGQVLCLSTFTYMMFNSYWNLEETVLSSPRKCWLFLVPQIIHIYKIILYMVKMIRIWDLPQNNSWERTREYGKEMRLGDGFTHWITLLSLILKCFHFLIIKKGKKKIILFMVIYTGLTAIFLNKMKQFKPPDNDHNEL